MMCIEQSETNNGAFASDFSNPLFSYSSTADRGNKPKIAYRRSLHPESGRKV